MRCGLGNSRGQAGRTHPGAWNSIDALVDALRLFTRIFSVCHWGWLFVLPDACNRIFFNRLWPASRRRRLAGGSARRAVALTLLLTPAWAVAAPGRTHWELGAGMYLLSVPAYAGARQYQTYLLPFPYVVYRGPVLRTTRRGIKAVLGGGRLRFSLSASVSPPVSSTDASPRAGMQNLPLTFGIGPLLDWQLVDTPRERMDLRFALRNVSTLHLRQVGWLASPYLNIAWRRSGYDFTLAVGPNFADRRYNGYYYDVAPRYARSSRPTYRAGGGYDGTAVYFGVDRALGRMRLGLYVQYQNLHGAVFADSPLVRTRDYLAGGVRVAWVFAQSSAD